MPGGFSILGLTFWHIPPSAGEPLRTGRATQRKDSPLSAEENKAIVGRWFTEFWGPDFNPAVIDELAAPNIRFE